MIDANYQDHYLPPWAASKGKYPYMTLLAQLSTKDGRTCGNAVVVAIAPEREGISAHAIVLTDAGNLMNLTPNEMEEYFHPVEYIQLRVVLEDRIDDLVIALNDLFIDFKQIHAVWNALPDAFEERPAVKATLAMLKKCGMGNEYT
ncbi:MAG: hypothetical protein COA47_10110 [Robiginitomaculum sp.]|nr:MAG: hypothetical protein COA47_10110 [Robiginitomaculum sp.]